MKNIFNKKIIIFIIICICLLLILIGININNNDDDLDDVINDNKTYLKGVIVTGIDSDDLVNGDNGFLTSNDIILNF